ncbi:hypothetical protein NMG60_11008108 [Bertholletia excelsa]
MQEQRRRVKMQDEGGPVIARTGVIFSLFSSLVLRGHLFVSILRWRLCIRMEFRSLTSRTRRRLSMDPSRCVLFHHAKAFQIMVVLMCTIFLLNAFKPSSVKELQSLVEYDSCESFKNNHNAGEVTSGYYPSRRTALTNFENTLGNAKLFCSPSTLPAILAKEHVTEATGLEASAFQFDATLHVGSAQARYKLSWSDYVACQLLGGQSGSCSQIAVIKLPIQSHNSPTEVSKSLGFKLLIQTSGSHCPMIEVVCKDIVNIFSRLNSKHNYEQQIGRTEYGNVITESLGRSIQSPLQTKEMAAEELDDLLLRNWKSQGTANGMSVIDDQEALFPLFLVGTHHSMWIIVKNPSPQPIVMQLTLHSGEIIYEYRPPDGLLPQFLSSRFILSGCTTSRRYGSSIAKITLTEAYVLSCENESIGPIPFHHSKRCGWGSSSLIRNTRSGVAWFSLQGYGGSNSLVLGKGPKLVEKIEFRFSFISLLNLFPPDIYHNLEEAIYAFPQPVSNEFFAKDTGDLLLDVERIKVSETECGLDGSVVHSFEGFSVEPGELTMLLIAYQTDFSAGTVHTYLELDLGAGILLIPIKATLCLRMLNLCRRSAFWSRVKKFSLGIFLISVLVFFIFFFILPQLMAFMTKDYFSKKGLSSVTAAERDLKSCCGVCDKRNSYKLAIPRKMKSLMRSIGKEEASRLTDFDRSPDGQGVTTSEQGMTARQVELTVGDQRQTNHLMEPDLRKEALDSCFQLDSGTMENHDPREASKNVELKGRTRREKGRRQRKKRRSGTGLVGLFEVSSSQSGNSTPSSPLSPAMSLTTKSLSSDADQSFGAHNEFVQVVEQQCEKSSGTEPACRSTTTNHEVAVKNSNVNLAQEQLHAPMRIVGEPIQLPSATLSSTSKPAPNMVCPSPLLTSTSTIAPHARAPGSKLCNQKTVKTDKKVGLEDQFRYDIWGDHLFGLNLMGRSPEVCAMTSNVAESHSDSFFVMGPQIVMTKSQRWSVSYQKG